MYPYHDSSAKEAAGSSSVRALAAAPLRSSCWLPLQNPWQVRVLPTLEVFKAMVLGLKTFAGYAVIWLRITASSNLLYSALDVRVAFSSKCC
jgi:hypothetical protein